MNLIDMKELLLNQEGKIPPEGIDFLKEMGIIQKVRLCPVGHECKLKRYNSLDGWVWR